MSGAEAVAVGEEEPVYKVSVRALCEFSAKAGDLDLRFTPAPSAREGMAGHLLVTGRRQGGYEREVSLRGRYRELEVRGRADGYDPTKNRLEEIKTFRGHLELMPANHRALHWAQAKIYAWLVCRERELEQIEVALVYFDVVKQKETLLCETHQAAKLEEFFNRQCELFLDWAKQEMAHRAERNRVMAQMKFPFADFRLGQRPLAEAVYRGASMGRCLLIEAPTGIGKTLGTLFPLLKALPRKQLDKVFFLTAKTPGRRLALDALKSLDTGPLRSLELVAREKSCEHPDKACHGDSCPLAQGFYDRLPAARQAAAQETFLDQQRLRQVALEHNICPYYLGQEMARWSDVIVGDYNYYFDLSAMLYALTNENQWQVALLADEAHNLVDRARGMYSAELSQTGFREVKKQAPKALKSPFEKLLRQWNALNKSQVTGSDADDYLLLPQIPLTLITALQNTAAAITDYLAEEPFALDSRLMQFYFDALHFLRIAELYDIDTFLCDLSWQRGAGGKSNSRKNSQLFLRNLIPAALLRPRFEGAHSATLFSATFRPPRYYRDLLGLPPDTVDMNVESPFIAEQLEVRIAPGISTRYNDRAASIAPIVQLVAAQFERRPGNYLAFFSSYQYLEQVRQALQQSHPQLPIWAQDRRMNEAARQAFLDKFEQQGQGIGFAVLGGAFAEGIDLPGSRLIGAFVATLGLPQINLINEQLKLRMEDLFGEGYDYTYLYPGLRKVVQAAGRVIRTESDTGVVHLIDDRFNQSRVRALLPSWWKIREN